MELLTNNLHREGRGGEGRGGEGRGGEGRGGEGKGRGENTQTKKQLQLKSMLCKYMYSC